MGKPIYDESANPAHTIRILDQFVTELEKTHPSGVVSLPELRQAVDDKKSALSQETP